MKKQLFVYGRYSGIAFQLIIIVLLGVGGGMLLDNYLQLKLPIFTLLFSVLAIVLALYYVLRDLK